MKTLEKTYIGLVEAQEFVEENYLPNLPKNNGKVWAIVPAIASGLPCLEFGKDEHGYYIAEEDAYYELKRVLWSATASQRKDNMLTLQQLKDMKPGIFDSGVTTDDESGVNMTRSGQSLRWVATRGGIHDWAIYVAPEDWSEDRVRDMGDKVHDRSNVKKLVPCDDEALGMYRD
jgi:hypothetical protein